MSDKNNNVIDLRELLNGRRKGKAAQSKTAKEQAPKEQAPVVDMTVRRNELLQQERRKVRRTILSEFIGACVVVPQKGLLKVNIYDISSGGIAFDTDESAGQFRIGEQVAMRVYLNHQTYFPFVVEIQNTRLLPEEGVVRHGANFMKETLNRDTLQHFVRFIESVSATLQKDTGDIMVSNLRK